MPDAPKETCSGKTCFVSWSRPANLGDIYISNLYFRIRFPALKREEILNSTGYNVDDLSPGTKYHVDISTQVRNSHQVVLWESKPVGRDFTTPPVGKILMSLFGY